jgi:ankyrin repeat protein
VSIFFFTLSEKLTRLSRRFQWVFCQLDMLRHTVELDVRAILAKLPKTLDETYERVLKDINESNRERACRLLHCLAVAVRPLRVEELAEILTFDFDAAWEGIPKFHAERRPKDQEEAVLSICSSLITIVDNRGSRVVQFSHFSVKEFLTSNHLASSTGQLTPYHTLPGRAHTILAQVCLSLLLHLDDSDDSKTVKDSPLAEYAARNWVAHAQFEDVTSCVEHGMISLFDPNRPHFSAWIRLYDIDAESGEKLSTAIASPLYYSALCGFHDLVRRLALKYPPLINTFGGSFGFPAVAALYRNHFSVAELLLKHGGRVDVRDMRQQTALYKAIDRQPGKVALEAVRFLLDHGADVNARRDDLWTPLHLAVNIGELSVARMLLEYQADVNSRNDAGQAPLHLLCTRETRRKDDRSDIAKLLLERGAKVDVKDKNGATPLQLASYNQRVKIVRVLLDHGANADTKNDQGKIPLQLAYLTGSQDSPEDGVGVALLLLEHGATGYARDKYQISSSDLGRCIREEIGQTLVGSRGQFEPENNSDHTAFRLWIEGEYYAHEHTSFRLSHILPQSVARVGMRKTSTTQSYSTPHPTMEA